MAKALYVYCLFVFSAGHIVAVSYFRAGYTPVDYPSSVEWSALRRITMTDSIKCPSIGYHLAGAKKIQQELTAPCVLERFVSPTAAALLRSTFGTLLSLNASSIATALSQPDDWVLKPQREGGGNNYWGQQMVEKLTNMSEEEHGAFILMKRIKVKFVDYCCLLMYDVLFILLTVCFVF